MTIDKTKKTPPQTPRIEIGLTPRILDRYVAKEFLLGYLIAVFVVLSLRVVLDLFIELDEFVEDSPSGTSSSFFTVIGYIVAYYTPKLFEYFRDFSGVMIILAAAFSLVRMSRQNELTAVLASGISLKRLLAPIILLAMLLNLLMVFDQEVILPRLAGKLVRDHDEIAGVDKMKISLLADRDNALLSAIFDPDTKIITQLLIILRRDDGLGTGLITADKAVWQEQHQHWQLTNGLFVAAEGTRQAITSWPSDLSPEYIWLQKNSN
ncbi:MAG: LptF/LptG family permease, partial [Planctomycetes bacterium]|nr:LptF/LptG family permease [Planctomycetota bacterium]